MWMKQLKIYEICDPSDQNQGYIAAGTRDKGKNLIKSIFSQFSVFDRKQYVNIF